MPVLAEEEVSEGRIPAVGTRFRSIAPFYRKNFIRWITDAKRAETRAARIAEMVKALAEGRQEG